MTAVLALTACGGGTTGAAEDAAPPTLVIGGIPDQEVSLLEERFSGLAEHLSEQVGIRADRGPRTLYNRTFEHLIRTSASDNSVDRSAAQAAAGFRRMPEEMQRSSPLTSERSGRHCSS